MRIGMGWMMGLALGCYIALHYIALELAHEGFIFAVFRTYLLRRVFIPRWVFTHRDTSIDYRFSIVS